MEPFLQEHQAPFIPRSQIPWHSALALAAPEGSSVPLLPHRWEKNHKEWTNPKPKPPGDRSCTLLGLSVGATKCLSQQRTTPFSCSRSWGRSVLLRASLGSWPPPHSQSHCTRHRPGPQQEMTQPKGRHHLFLLSHPAQMTPNTPGAPWLPQDGPPRAGGERVSRSGVYSPAPCYRPIF